VSLLYCLRNMMGYQDRLGTKTYVQQVEPAARFV
jgi:hypothetical protein